MRDALLNDLINTLERHGCEIKVSLPATRGRGARRKPITPVGMRVSELRDSYGLTLQTISDLLDEKLHTTIAVASLNAWENGAVPRKVPEETLIRALDEITKEHQAVEGGAWVAAEEVKAMVDRWMEVMTPRQIAVAADEAVTTIRSWATGKHRVLRTKWNRVVPLVNQMSEVMKSHRDHP
ncbi:MAG: hypothetical protein GX771_06810 [Halomonadaceae bacterium]|nr:hypothetical protein [Halomonadaceae bacterium]